MPVERVGSFIRERLKPPSQFVPGSFRTKRLPGGHELVVGRLKSTGRFVGQSLRHPASEGLAYVRREHAMR